MNPTLYRAFTRLILGAAGALMPLAHAAAEPAKCTYTPVAKLPLRYSGPSLEITTGGSLNDTPAEMLVDTGFFETFLTRTGTERRNLKLFDTGNKVSGIGGSSPIYGARVGEVVVGPVRAHPRTLPVLNNAGYTPSYDGILGAPFLFQTDLEVSLATKELTFFLPENCGSTFLGYWGKNVIDIPLRRHNQGHANPHFFVTINGTQMEAMIDTGAGASTISSDGAKRAGIEFDTPDVPRAGSLVGVGDYTAGLWYVTVKTFQMGDETVQNAQFAVQDSGMGGAHVTLGADFLRSHRVLFAMSQDKLYFSYVGGEPFGQRRKLEPWIQAEADGGNADAQLALANAYKRGSLVPRDDGLAATWLEKATAGGSPHALLRTGRALMLRGDVAGGATHLRAALDKLPAERYGALWLYIARVRGGQAALAKSELEATISRSARDEWPKPIAEFYLGALSSDKLLAQAADDRKKGDARRCEALAAMAEWHRAHAQPEQLAAVSAQLKNSCNDIKRGPQAVVVGED